MPKLQVINMQSRNFRYTKSFVIDGFESLQSIIIGNECFYDSSKNENTYSCTISNCPLLSSIAFGSHAFHRYSVFNLLNVPNLQSITMNGYNFAASSLLQINRTMH